MPSRKQPATSKSPRRVHNKPVAVVKRASGKVQPATKKQQLIDLLSGAKPVAAEKVSRTLDWHAPTESR